MSKIIASVSSVGGGSLVLPYDYSNWPFPDATMPKLRRIRKLLYAWLKGRNLVDGVDYKFIYYNTILFYNTEDLLAVKLALGL